MIDTLELSMKESILLPVLDHLKPGDNFVFNGFNCDLGTIRPRSYFANRDWPLWLTAYDAISGVKISGPMRRTELGSMFLPHVIRLNIPHLAGLPKGCLPISDEQFRRAFNQAREILHWLPEGWLDKAHVKRIDLTMNFELPPIEMLEMHLNMRHKRVRKDSFKSDPAHGSIYWNGDQSIICLYDKSR